VGGDEHLRGGGARDKREGRGHQNFLPQIRWPEIIATGKPVRTVAGGRERRVAGRPISVVYTPKRSTGWMRWRVVRYCPTHQNTTIVRTIRKPHSQASANQSTVHVTTRASVS